MFFNAIIVRGMGATNMTAKILGPIGIKAFEARGISSETAVRFQTYTGRAVDSENGDRTVVPDPAGNIVVFPFIEQGRIVAEKYRAPGKKFWQRKGGKRTFWNVDALDDPGLENGAYPLIITEGEIDALTAIDCGFPLAVSVPDGAPAVREGEDPAELPPADAKAERTGKFEYVWLNRDRLKRVKRFVLAVDADAPGRRLEAELLRRLSPSRCLSVTYPDGCKDLNEVRTKHGVEAVVRCLNGARPYPVRGLYRLSDYPDVADPETFMTGFPDLDEGLKLWLGEMMIVTGIPASGKSSFILNMCVNVAWLYGWVIGVASFEIPTVPALRHKLRLAKIGTPRSSWTQEQISNADKWIGEHFVFIDDDPSGEDDADLTLEWLLDRAADSVLRDGTRVLVIDPWNEIEHARPHGESETEYHNRALRMIRRFATRYKVIAIVIAHPTKDVAKDGKIRIPSLYDISGSAAWYNKPDHGIVVHVPDPNTNETIVSIRKVRFNWSGKRTEVTLRYDPETESYASLDGQIPIWRALGM
jgi:twinkle protein